MKGCEEYESRENVEPIQGAGAAHSDEDHLRKLSKEAGGKPVDEDGGVEVNRCAIDENFGRKI